jgi:hypothetical protein
VLLVDLHVHLDAAPFERQKPAALRRRRVGANGLVGGFALGGPGVGDQQRQLAVEVAGQECRARARRVRRLGGPSTAAADAPEVGHQYVIGRRVLKIVCSPSFTSARVGRFVCDILIDKVTEAFETSLASGSDASDRYVQRRGDIE